MLGLPFAAPVPPWARGPRRNRGREGLFLLGLALLADAALQLFAGLALARLADLLASRGGCLALARVLRLRAHLVAHAIASLLARLALAGLFRLLVGGLDLGDALLAGLGVFRLRAIDAPFALRLRGIGGRLGKNRGAERQYHGGQQGPEHGGPFGRVVRGPQAGQGPGAGLALQRATPGPR